MSPVFRTAVAASAAAMLLALAASPHLTDRNRFAATVSPSDLGLAAASDHGIDLHRLLLADTPSESGPRWTPPCCPRSTSSCSAPPPPRPQSRSRSAPGCAMLGRLDLRSGSRLERMTNSNTNTASAPKSVWTGMVAVEDTALAVTDTRGPGRPVVYLNGSYATRRN